MHLTRLDVNDLRCHIALGVDLTPGPITLIGDNGVGKTSVIEAIGYLASGASHRVATDAPLIRTGCDRAVVEGHVSAAGAVNRLAIEIMPGRSNRARLNGGPVRPRELIGRLRTVLFSPEDCALITGEPGGRRRFLDDLLRQHRPRQAAVQAEYERTVRQRSALLKQCAQGRGSHLAEELAIWDEALIQRGSDLTVQRWRCAADLGPLVDQAYAELADDTSVQLTYVSAALGEHADAGDHAEVASGLRNALNRLRAAEIARGSCLVGPHRDDLRVDLGGLPARGHASQGEVWSLSLALRLGARQLLAEIDDGRGEPVLLCDDVFSALDNRRRTRVSDILLTAEQVIVTGASADDVPAALRGSIRRLDPGAQS